MPISHTCFKSIEVPIYKNYEQLKTKLDIAFTTGTEGFGFGWETIKILKFLFIFIYANFFHS